jgi:DMSO/TMAO reductase YedYZ heme-binding membrane subunit
VVYGTAILGVVHYWWLVKADVRRPLTYAAVVVVLLAFRAYWKTAHAPSGRLQFSGSAPMAQTSLSVRSNPKGTFSR